MNKTSKELKTPIMCKNEKKIDDRPWIDSRDMIVFLSVICGILLTFIAVQNGLLIWKNTTQLIVGCIMSIIICSLIIGFMALKIVYIFNGKEKSLPQTTNHRAGIK